MYLRCFFRIDVLSLQQMSGKVSSDWKDGQIERSVFISDFLEDLGVCCVSRVKDLLLVGCLNDEPSPKSTVVIEGRSP